MELIKYIFLGIVQGITEPIPVSSSGHLLIFQKLLKGLDTIDYGILATITNLGSLLAITILFRSQIIKLIKDSLDTSKLKKKNTMMTINIVGT